MSRNPTTAAGVRLQGEADAITDEVARRTHTWIDQMRRGDNSPHRLKSILLGLSFAIIDHLPEDSLPEGWASLLAEYVDATADDSEPGNPAEQTADEDETEAGTQSQGQPPQGDVLDSGSAKASGSRSSGKHSGTGGMGRKVAPPPRRPVRRKIKGPA